MKKALLLFITVCAFSYLQAQDSGSESTGGFILGAKFGLGMVNYESIITDEKNFAESTWDNLSYGILTGYKLNGLLSFQLEGLYSQYGAKNIIPTYVYSQGSPALMDYGTNSTVDQVDMDIYTVDIPLSIKLSFGSGTFAPYIYGGVNYGINVSAKTTIIRQIKLGEAIDYRESYDDITDRVVQSEFAPIAGCGFKFDMVKFSLFGDLRYKYGLTNLSNVDNNLGYTNSAFWLSAGFFIYL